MMHENIAKEISQVCYWDAVRNSYQSIQEYQGFQSADEIHVLHDEPIRRRIEGGHREDGYQYPNTIVEENRMFVIYSVNKEDVEAAVVNFG